MKLSKICLVAFLAFIVISEARAQLPQTDSVAAKVAHNLSHFKGKQVIVFDFVDSSGRLTALGQYLADNFSAALTKSAVSFQMMDRSKITMFLEKHRIPGVVIADPEMAVWIAHELDAKAAILGQVSVDDTTLDIQTNIYRVDSGAYLAGFKTASPITNDVRDLMGKTIVDVETHLYGNTPAAGTAGYTDTVCIHCPGVPFPDKLVGQKIHETVILKATIGVDGKAHGIVVVKGAANQFTEQAVKGVSHWIFKPATNAHGQLAAVQQTIEVTFNQD